jgi:hypothetical protein
MIIKYGIRDDLAFVLFDDGKEKHLLSEPCYHDFFETFAYGMPMKSYRLIVFSREIESVKSTKPSFKKTWNSLVDGAGFKKTVLDSVGDDLKSIIGI